MKSFDEYWKTTWDQKTKSDLLGFIEVMIKESAEDAWEEGQKVLLNEIKFSPRILLPEENEDDGDEKVKSK